MKSAPAGRSLMDKAPRSKCGGFASQSAHVIESRSCLPLGLQERHLQALRHHASLLAAGSRLPLTTNFTANSFKKLLSKQLQKASNFAPSSGKASKRVRSAAYLEQ